MTLRKTGFLDIKELAIAVRQALRGSERRPPSIICYGELSEVHGRPVKEYLRDT